MLFHLRLATSAERPRHPEVPEPRWWERLWARLHNWLWRPVDFPGKWPAQKPPSERYNSKDSQPL
jgi:hypothetical protein